MQVWHDHLVGKYPNIQRSVSHVECFSVLARYEQNSLAQIVELAVLPWLLGAYVGDEAGEEQTFEVRISWIKPSCTSLTAQPILSKHTNPMSTV